MERQIRTLEKSVESLKEDLRQSEDRNQELRSRIRGFEKRLGSLFMSIEEDSNNTTTVEEETRMKGNRQKNRDGAGTRTQDNGSKNVFTDHIEVLKMYEQRIAEQAKLLDRAMSRVLNTDVVNKEDTPGNKKGFTKRGPRIVNNIQIVPPKYVVDSVSEVASAESVAESPHWQTLKRNRPKRTTENRETETEAVGAPTTPRGRKLDRNQPNEN